MNVASLVLALGLLPGQNVATPTPISDVCGCSAPVLFADDCGCCNGPGSQVQAGAGLALIQPRWGSNPAFRVNGSGGGSVLQEFDYDFDDAPLAWIHFQNCSSLGARVRYFQYAQSERTGARNPADGSSTITLAAPLGLGVLAAEPNKRVDVKTTLNVLSWDVEATADLSRPCWSILAALGVRYAHLSQNYNAYVGALPPPPPPPPAPPPPVASAFNVYSGHNFNGAGPTLGLDLVRFLGDSGLGFYANGRFSLLFGSTHASATRFEKAGPGGPLRSQEVRQVNDSQVLPVGELEIGLQLARQFGGMTGLVQAGLVGQVWWNAGNAANNNAILQPSDNENLSFIGFTLRAGVTF